MADNVQYNWGDFCTCCGLAQHGEFPRKCGNGHYTYAAPVSVGVALQPVEVNGKIGVLTVQRNINPYKGEFALPGGFVNNKETGQPAAVRELSEEAPIKHFTEQAVYFSEATGGSHNDADPRSHSMYFYKMPLMREDDIDFSFQNEEVQSLKLLFLANNKTMLIDKEGKEITLCFSTHQAAAIKFLNNY